MPTYDYECRSCGTVTEVIHPMLEPGPTSCERCGGALRRVLYPAGIIFKGSGFYRTDSRNADGPSTTEGAAPSADPGAASTTATDDGGAKGGGAQKPAGAGQDGKPATTRGEPASAPAAPAESSS